MTSCPVILTLRSRHARPVRAPNRKSAEFCQKSFALLIFSRIFAVPNEGTRGVAQLASASGLGPEGPVFESQYPDNLSKEPADFQQVPFR